MRLILFLVVLSFPLFVKAQKTDRKLEKKIRQLIAGYNGDIGIYIKDLERNRIVSINADTVFPTASVIKVPILVGIMDKMNKGELRYSQELNYSDSLLYPGADILGSFKDSQKIELGKLVMLMLTMSDNTASLWLQSLAGGGQRINQLMEEAGLRSIKVNSRTPGRENYRSIYGWGQSTPADMAALFEKMYNGQIINQAASEKMLRLLNRNFFDRVAVSQIPPYATVFSKYGAVNETRNEVVLVKGKNSSYLFCIMTKNNRDQGWTDTNEAWVLTRKISALLWGHFEKRDNWSPAPGSEKFK